MLTIIKDLSKVNSDGTYLLLGYTNIFGDNIRMRYFASWSEIMKMIQPYKKVTYFVHDDELVVDGITTFNKVDIFVIRRVTNNKRIRSKISDKEIDEITEKLGNEAIG